MRLAHLLGNVKRWPSHTRYCPLCRRYERGFEPHGVVPRPDARCPHCGALERHRLIWLFMTSRTNLCDGRPKRMLHVAPEQAFEKPMSAVPGLDRLTADLAPGAMVQMDLTDIHYPDATFDVIYCSHVLEHIPDDRRAMREMFRVLKPGGWAILQVPILRDVTFEDPSVTDPAERLRLFGQDDHVRVYGLDYADRLRAAGFRLKVEDFGATLSARRRQLYGLMEGERVYFCEKP